jgi:hypothetical protein
LLDAPYTVVSYLIILMFFGSAECTEEEYQVLLAMASLKLTAVIPFEPTRIFSGRKPNWVIMECKPLKKGKRIKLSQ